MNYIEKGTVMDRSKKRI